MAQTRNYATKKKGKTEVYPFWNLEDIKKMIDWFENNNEWDGYLITMLELLLGRRVGDTVSMKWSDFYFENGNQRTELDTVEEQKTGKITRVPISNMVFEAIEIYRFNTDIKPMEHYEEYIFEFSSKSEWIKRKGSSIYKEDNLEKWCNFLGKDLSDKRKQKILSDFEKQNRYKTLGDYLYYEVEWNDVVKWHSDAYRRLFMKAAKDCNIQQKVSTHSLRKSFGYWIHQMHQYDPDCLLSLQKLFNHSDLQTTMNYIGLSFKKTQGYVEDHGQLIKNILDGNTTEIIKNSPVVSLKSEDFGDIIMAVINAKDMSDVEKYQMAINMANDKRVI